MVATLDRQPTQRNRPQARRSTVNRYYRAEPKTESPFIKKTPTKSPRKILLGFLDIILMAGLLLLLLYSLGLKSNPLIEANDFTYHAKSTYATSADKQFSRLQNRNKLTFDETGVVKALQSQYPELSNVQVELPFFSERPVVHLTVAKPSFVLNSPAGGLVIDSEGVAVAPQSALNLKRLPTIDDHSGYAAKAGAQVMSADSVSFIDSLIAQCRAAKVPVSTLTLPPTPQELQLRTSDQAYYTKFYLGGDISRQAGQYLAARTHFNQTHQSPAEYLDVRVPGKIFYK